MLARSPYNRPVRSAPILRTAGSRWRGTAAALVLAAVLGAGVARGDAPSPGGFRSPAAGERVTAGMSARVLWDRPGGLRVEGAAEMELLLSLDGGRTFPIRLTRDLAPETRGVHWRVPNFPTRAARIALRVGDGEEPDEERLELVSAPFEIVEDAALAPVAEPLHRIRGEWRTEAALPGPTPLPTSQDMNSETPDSLRALPGRLDAAQSPRAAGIAAPSVTVSERAPPPARPAPPRAPTRLSPPSFPLRP